MPKRRPGRFLEKRGCYKIREFSASRRVAALRQERGRITAERISLSPYANPRRTAGMVLRRRVRMVKPQHVEKRKRLVDFFFVPLW